MCMSDEDMLLPTQKANKFEQMIDRTIEEEFGASVDVLVKTTGRIFVREEGSSSEAASVLNNRYDEVLEELSTLSFSEYELVDGEEDNLVGASFYLKRDGW